MNVIRYVRVRLSLDVERKEDIVLFRCDRPDFVLSKNAFMSFFEEVFFLRYTFLRTVFLK